MLKIWCFSKLLNEPTFVMAENIGDAYDKLDEIGVLEYEFVHGKSINIVY